MLTKEWSDFDPTKGYEKRMQDVILKNGDTIYFCWPNAGVWNVCNEIDNPKYYGTEINCTDTSKVRLTHHIKLNP